MGASREIAPKLDFRSFKRPKKRKLQICAETSETARRAPLGVIFEESAFAPWDACNSSSLLSRVRDSVASVDSVTLHFCCAVVH